ncbi:MAG: histidine kinase [Bacillota bacterium]|nr:histidine kinase [Bacillota bacterium]
MDIKKWFNNISIKRKFIIMYSMIALPTLFVGILTYSQANYMVRQQLESSVDNELHTLSNKILSKADYYEYSVNQAVINAKFAYILTNDYMNLLNLVQDIEDYLNPYFTTVKFLNRSIANISIYHDHYMPEYGTFIVNTNEDAEAPWYRQALASLECEWFFDETNVYLARKFPPFMMGDKTAILAFMFNKNTFFREILGSYSPDSGIILYDNYGNLVYEDHLEGIKYTSAQFYENAPDTLRGVIVRSQAIESMGLTVTMYTWNKTVATSFQIIGITVVLIVLTMMLIFITLWVFDQSMIKPLVKLDRNMHEVRKGNYTSLMGRTGNDEIGRISNQFDKMVKDVERLISELYEANIKKTRAELTALRTQINPHFLYNSLSAITWKAMFSNNQEIHDIATSLATFYRTVLSRGSMLIEVENEIKNIEAYVMIQRILRDNTFDVVWNIQPEVHKHEMLCFILQPLVENAIVHGLDMKTEGKGLLSISAYIQNDHIWFHVEDNGNGMDQQLMDQYEFNSKGYGIKNVNERIKLYYGEGYSVTYATRQPQGVIATIRLPVKRKIQ